MDSSVDGVPMEGDKNSTSDRQDESGAPPRRRRRSQRKDSGHHRMSVSESNAAGSTAAEASVEADADTASNLESDGGDDRTDDDPDFDENSTSEADALDYDTYYSFNEDLDDIGGPGVGGGSTPSGNVFNNNDDPEYFAYECLTVEKAEKTLQDQISVVCNVANISPSQGKLLLHLSRWSTSEALKNIPPARSSSATNRSQTAGAFHLCDVCAVTQSSGNFSHLTCKHLFCKGCWECHFEQQILQGLSTSLSCMSSNCDERADEKFVVAHITNESVRDRYKQLAFFDCIRCHPQLRFCPGNNCKYIVKAEKCVHKRATCVGCKTSFCYQCGGDYHAPTDCETIKRWLTKCADDSETANYISAHTKDCPKCNICIEKNGGCNHMQCYNCKHDFCWMCLGDWKTHGSEYYECSRYKENPNIAHESAHAQAREALKKYLHYFERWENHSNSMKLEAQTLAKIKTRINEKVMNSCGTWIDWQYLLDAASLLAKCRYTLQYTYPYAYYMEPSNRKKLFECQQAQLEAEIENLSWKIEHAEITDRGDLENQIDVAEKRRTSLLKDFLPS